MTTLKQAAMKINHGEKATVEIYCLKDNAWGYIIKHRDRVIIPGSPLGSKYAAEADVKYAAIRYGISLERF